MAELPPKPIPPKQFIEEWLPRAFAEAEAAPEAQELDVQLGVHLHGDGGGEWVLHCSAASSRVAPGSREQAAFTFVQSVADWRGALWEGRGGAIGRQAVAMFQPGAQAAAPRPGRWARAAEPRGPRRDAEAERHDPHGGDGRRGRRLVGRPSRSARGRSPSRPPPPSP